jgi:catechol 2,3-dioxygenase-like lactoylglutathione lyase family enzyme
MSIVAVMGIKVNCAQIERSVAFYESLGFAPRGSAATSNQAWLMDLYGLPDGRLRSQIMVRTEDPNGLRLELLEWADQTHHPFAANVIGMAMLTLRSNDLDTDRTRLEAAGGAVVGYPAVLENPTGRTLLMTVRDPDGMSLQLAQFVRTVG